MMERIKIVTSSGKEFGCSLIRKGNAGGAIELRPDLGAFAGSGTLYPNTIKTEAIMGTLGTDFTMIDLDYEDRFSKACEVEDGISKNRNVIFRDHKLNQLILLKELNVPDSMVAFSGNIDVSVILLAGVRGEMLRTTLGETVTNLILTNIREFRVGTSVYRSAPEVEYEIGGNSSLVSFISLGTSDDLIGPDCLIESRVFFGNEVAYTNNKKSENVLFRVDF